MSTVFSLNIEMSRLTRDGTAEFVLRDQILRCANRDKEKITFPVQLTTSRIGILTRSILTLAMCYDYTVPLYYHGLYPRPIEHRQRKTNAHIPTI